MDLASAIGVHAEWKTKLRKAMSLEEQLDAATISRDNCCDLGRWLHGEGKQRFGTRPGHPTCVAKHAAFHTEAAKVARAINEKKFAEAEAALGAGTSYASASSALGMALMQLKKECE